MDEEKSAAAASKVPTSMILRQGRVAPSLSIAVEDLRKLMMPNTAVKLKERRCAWHARGRARGGGVR